MEVYISLKEFRSKVERHELYSGYVIGVGYAYYMPLIVRPQQSLGSILLDGEYAVIWIQKINNSPEMKMRSLKLDTTKWTDCIGSTKLQRFAAQEFMKKCNGVIKNESKSDIYVEYKEVLFSTSITKRQYFHEDGTLVSQSGEIRQMRGISRFEMWLESESEYNTEALLKIICNIIYGTPNSISKLLTGRSIAGSSTNCNDKVSALIDVGPGMILWATKATNIVSNVGKGLKGYNQYVKKNPYLKGNSGLPSGMTWQQNASHSFQTNKQSLIMNQNAEFFLEQMGRGTAVIDEYSK